MQKTTRIALGPLEVLCEIATDHSRGLQGHAPLGPQEGMLFTYTPPRTVRFHMGSVHFPIDLVFCDADARVRRIVSRAQPGTRDVWGLSDCMAVVEVAGGRCAAAGVRVDDRFEHRKLIDEADPEARDQPLDGYRQQWGYQPTDGLDHVGPHVRQGSIRDQGLFAVSMTEAVARHADALPWVLDTLNDGRTEHAVLTRQRLAAYARSLGISRDLYTELLADLGTKTGLELVGDGLVLAGLADLFRVAPQHKAIVLYRGRRG